MRSFAIKFQTNYHCHLVIGETQHIHAFLPQAWQFTTYRGKKPDGERFSQAMNGRFLQFASISYVSPQNPCRFDLIYYLVPCDNDFEYEFAKFLENAKDVRTFSKLPQQFGFSIEYTDNNANLRYYYPDFVVKTEEDDMWLVETKGQESLEVRFKDRAAQLWCENATILTGQHWRYVKVPQKEYDKLQPVEFYDLLTFVD